jgi:hypothetical protein
MFRTTRYLRVIYLEAFLSAFYTAWIGFSRMLVVHESRKLIHVKKYIF